MSDQKTVNELFVNFELKDKAKKLGCRWDGVTSRWYISHDTFISDMDIFNDFRALAIADTNTVSSEDLKLLGCKFNMNYKKWTINKTTYENHKLEFDLHKLSILAEIVKTYNYVPPPVKSEADQLAELMLIMSDNYIGD